MNYTDPDESLTAYFDGGCWPNPGGRATFGIVVKAAGKTIHHAHGIVGEGRGMSNNVAEFAAAAEALEWMIKQRATTAPILLRGDSDLVVRLLDGSWKARPKRKGLYLPYYFRAASAAAKFSRLRFEWIPRAQNHEADALTEQAMGSQPRPQYAARRDLDAAFQATVGPKEQTP